MASSADLSEEDKKDGLQSALNMAASNGDLERLKALLSGTSKSYLDINAPDDEGTPPLVYASCFGHEAVVNALLDAGADIEKKDRHQWTSLMWATANGHSSIAKSLLDRGASVEAKSSTGRTAFDFVTPNSDMSGFLQDKGYKIGSVGVGDDFYSSGLSQDKLEEEMQENEMRRRMQMDSAINLEVDLGNLGFEEQPELTDDIEDDEGFVWDRCLNDQMFVFQEDDLPQILDIVITNMQPQRSHSQKPVPANVIFLSARYAHYHGNPDLLKSLLLMSTDLINDVVEQYHLDMTVLAFWMSNATLLLHYLRKDTGLVGATGEFQLHLTELINEIFVLIIRDAERRIDRVLDTAVLQHETIPGLDDVQFKTDWNLFKSKPKTKAEESVEKRFGPPTPQERAKISPRNITSLLSSTLFVLDLYDVHSSITVQIMAQLYYWLGAELFNRIITSRKYLARSKAMQSRMNLSVLEEWARTNNRQPDHFENGSSASVGETLNQAAQQHLAPPIQLLQWLQIFSSIGDNMESLETTIKQMTRLSPQQLNHSVSYYRFEVGEPGLPKTVTRRLQQLQKEVTDRKAKRKSIMIAADAKSPAPNGHAKADSPTEDTGPGFQDDDDMPEHLLLDPGLMLPFSLPTSIDLLVSFGAGFGGVNRERARKYVPTLPPEFLQKLDASTSANGRRMEAAYDGLTSNDVVDRNGRHGQV